MASLQEELTVLSYTSSSTLLSASYTPYDNSLNLFVNGVFQRPALDYSLNTNQVEIFAVLPVDYSVWGSYDYYLTPPPLKTDLWPGSSTWLRSAHQPS